MKFILVLPLLALACVSSGCALSRGPAAALGAGALIGGAVGQSVGIGQAFSGAGNSADAMTGAVIGVVVANEASKAVRTTDERLKDAYQQGQRDARVEASAEYWNEATYADGSHPSLQKTKGKVRQVQSDTRYIEGVKQGAYYVPQE